MYSGSYRRIFVWLSERRRSWGKWTWKKWKRRTRTNKKNPRGIRPCRSCPSPRVQNILRPLKMRALTCALKEATSICLAKRKLEVWGKWPPKKTGITRPRHGAIIPRRCSPFPQSAKYISRSLKIGALACVVKDAMNIWLAEQKPEVWSKWPWKKTRKAPGALDPTVVVPPLGV